ncbi:hypothetical protein C8R43DRAFT_1124498 [Mycena crocata]|nr:hypothetical protein C8R43DRAFT_1124498 [Mycena crocata]
MGIERSVGRAFASYFQKPTPVHLFTKVHTLVVCGPGYFGSATFILLRDLDDFQAYTQSTSTPKGLFIEFELFGTPVSEILALSQLAAYLEDVRRLGIMPHWAHSQHLLSLTAPTLQQLRLDCVSDCRTLSLFAESPPIQLPTVNNITIPSLPALNSAEFIIMQHDQSAPWLADALSTLLALHGSPSLGEVVITIDAESHPDPTASLVNGQLAAVLDSLLAAHPAGPRIRWRLPDKYAHCSAFLVSLQAAMPRAHMRHRLSMQTYVKRSKYVYDAPRKRVFDDWVVDWGTGV